MVSFDVDRYLARIQFDGGHEPSVDTLVGLQAAHLVRVPFENLHVFHRLGVRVDVDWSYHKIVEQRRGGWCFELNGCFAELLRRLGYRVELLLCRTFDAATGGLSPDFDHLTLLVHVNGAAYLVDVGWGDNPLAPLPAEPGEYPAGRDQPASRPMPRLCASSTTSSCQTAPSPGSCSIRRHASLASYPSSRPAAAICRLNQGCRGPRSRLLPGLPQRAEVA
jgi:arylamine N-acetyltransferase